MYHFRPACKEFVAAPDSDRKQKPRPKRLGDASWRLLYSRSSTSSFVANLCLFSPQYSCSVHIKQVWQVQDPPPEDLASFRPAPA
jgi:hypothetical protein